MRSSLQPSISMREMNYRQRISSVGRYPDRRANKRPCVPSWFTLSDILSPSTPPAAKPTTPPVPVASEPDVADDWEVGREMNKRWTSNNYLHPLPAGVGSGYPLPASEGSGYHNPISCQWAVNTTLNESMHHEPYTPRIYMSTKIQSRAAEPQ